MSWFLGLCFQPCLYFISVRYSLLSCQVCYNIIHRFTVLHDIFLKKNFVLLLFLGDFVTFIKNNSWGGVLIILMRYSYIFFTLLSKFPFKCLISKKTFKKERFPLTRFLNIMSEETTTNDSTSHLLCAVVLQFFSDKCIVLIKCFISLCPTVPHIRISRVGEKHTPCLAKITIYLVWKRNITFSKTFFNSFKSKL